MNGFTTLSNSYPSGIMFKSDNLNAFLYEYKAVLYQKNPAPCAQNDLRMRDIVLETYPKTRSSILSTAIHREPVFETV